ncbi:Endonuclease/exonuclease/phosphatase [Crepidotus variabilis]|uniref:Endonuclease/exonuclease/phosphatase n=1 Tax=Crepidotus variabilis TaxID=179855 RepID=A0A9P6ERL2_9AGAR|nr:Endonuclease/exonuclease/phosphatase [Crepidotus variabilis]
MELEERKPYCTQVKIITWNVDMMSPHPEERLTTVLRHIEMDVLKCKNLSSPPEPCCILLQEVKDTVIPRLLEDEWVRRWFVVTPFTKDKWPEEAWYGNITLVSRSLHIAECHILHYGLTAMQRTALCVKLKLNHPGTHEKAIISIVNTHLESLKDGAIARPKQMEMCARFLRLRGVHGGIVAGDMNSISPEDGTIGKEVGLRDAWRQGDVEDGKTWGFQGQNEGKFPTNRLDKIFYLAGMGYKVEEPRRIGVGLKIRPGEEDEHWVSDHYGLETTLQMLKPRSNSAFFVSRNSLPHNHEVRYFRFRRRRSGRYCQCSTAWYQHPVSLNVLAKVSNIKLNPLNRSTTGVVVCQPLLLQWQGGQCDVVPGGDPSGTALIDFGKQTGNQLTWTVNVTTGTSIVLTIKDQTGTTAQSAPFSPTGTDTSCIGNGGGSSGGSSGSGSSASGSPSTTAGTTPKPATTTTTGAGGSSGSSTKPAGSGSSAGASTAPKPSNAASALGVQAGLLGAVSAAIFALVA